MDRFEISFSNWVIRYRLWILPILFVLVGLAALGLGNLKFSNSYEIFFEEDNPELMAFQAVENTFSDNNNILLAFEPEDGRVFTRETLAALEDFTEKAWQVPFSTRVDSITNFQHTEAEEDDLVVEDLVFDAMQLGDEELRKIKDIAINEPLLVNRLISPRGDITAINITLNLPELDEATESPTVVAYVRNLVAETLAANPGLKIYITGEEMINSTMREVSYRDMSTLVPLSFACMFVLLAFLVGGFSGTLVSILVIAMSVVTALGAGGYFHIPISPPSSIAPTVILTVAIANCVHILASFRQGLVDGLDRTAAMTESLRINVQPVTLASITTTLGFLSMNFSDSPPFHDLGNFVAAGVMTSLVLSLTLLPICMLWLPYRAKAATKKHDVMMEKLGAFVVRKQNGLFWGMLSLICLLVMLIPLNQLDDVFTNYFKEPIRFRIDTDYVDKKLTGIASLEFPLEARTTGGINEPAFLQEVEDFSNWLRQQPEVVHVHSITDTFKRLNKNMHGDDEAMYKLPGERELAAQYLLLYEMSLPYGLDLNNQINIDKTSTRLIATLKKTSSMTLLNIKHRGERWLDENSSYIKPAKSSSISIMFASMGQTNIRSMLWGTTVALLMISFLMIFALRSLRIGLVSLLPNLAPAAMGFGLWGLFVGEVGLGLSVVSTMTLGIVIDDSVHFLSKYLRARRENNMNAEDAVVYAFSTVGRALLITTLVLTAGFLVLATSSFALNSDMGLLTAVIICLALVADFLFLPPLLIKLEGKRHAQA